MNTYLHNSQGKQLYTNPENIKKASKRRKVGKPIGGKIVWVPGFSLYRIDKEKNLTI